LFFHKNKKNEMNESHALSREITAKDLDLNHIPRHIAIVMDGNGRWAQERHLPRTMGHKAGVSALREVIRAADNLGVEALTVFAFSSENWKRPQEEVAFLMNLFIEVLKTDFLDMMENNLVLRTSGDLSALPESTRKALEEAAVQTAGNRGIVLNIAVNYGGRWELVQACRKIASEVRAGQLDPGDISDEIIAEHLSTHPLPDPDLFIRTSGEERISNFLLWQMAYSEFYFTKIKWPDFTPMELYKAIFVYQNRHRRYGGL